MANEGAVASEQGDYGKAIATLEAVLVEAPDWDKGRLHRLLGNAYQESGEFEKAKVKYLEALSYDSDDTDARDDYAHLLWKHGDVKQAFGQYLILARTYRRRQAPQDWIDSLLVPLRDLSVRLGITEDELTYYLDPLSENRVERE